MSDRLEDFINQLQEQINEETRTALGEKGFERWLRPKYSGVIDHPDGYACITGACGGSFAAELALGKSPDEFGEITGDAILGLLGKLPEEERHCAFLAAETLQAALDSFMRKSYKTD